MNVVIRSPIYSQRVCGIMSMRGSHAVRIIVYVIATVKLVLDGCFHSWHHKTKCRPFYGGNVVLCLWVGWNVGRQTVYGPAVASTATVRVSSRSLWASFKNSWWLINSINTVQRICVILEYYHLNKVRFRIIGKYWLLKPQVFSS